MNTVETMRVRGAEAGEVASLAHEHAMSASASTVSLLTRSTTDDGAHDGWMPIRRRRSLASHMMSFLRPDRHRRLNILITETDARRLRAVVSRFSPYPHREVAPLAAELARAAIIDSSAIPSDIVTMNSRVVLEDHHSGDWSGLTLVYPSDVQSDTDISVLNSLGTALLGMRVGQEVSWLKSEGATKRLRVQSVPYQPERNGDFHL